MPFKENQFSTDPEKPQTLVEWSGVEWRFPHPLIQTFAFSRTEIDQLRTGTVAPPTPQTKNEKLTVKWLSNAVQELRTEISELQHTLNSSILLQDHEVHEAQMSLLQSDISSLSSELERFRTLTARKDAAMRLLQEELNSLRSDWRSMAEVNGRLRNQVRYGQKWNRHRNSLSNQAGQFLNSALRAPCRHPNRFDTGTLVL